MKQSPVQFSECMSRSGISEIKRHLVDVGSLQSYPELVLATGSSLCKAEGVCKRSTDTETKIFQLSSPSIANWQACTHVHKQSTQVCMHTQTYTSMDNNTLTYSPHTGTHTEATAEWSQLESQRHFGLSTARITGQVRTTHTDINSHTYTYTSPRG